MKKYELIILATKDKVNILQNAIPYYYENLNPKSVFVVANKEMKEDIKNIDKIEFVDEDSILEGMTKAAIEDIIEKITGKRKRAGWYFQQFIKLAWAWKCKDDFYVVIDSDTIPLNPITFLNEDNIYLLTQKIEYHEPYFDTINKLFLGKVYRPGNYSFIAENMVFDCRIVREILKEIENNNGIKGDAFYEKIMYAIDDKDVLNSGFSEFETYGCYLSIKHKNKFKLRKLRTAREAVYVLGSNLTEEKLKWAKKDYDMISIEVNDYKSILTKITDSAFFRKTIRMKTVNKIRQNIRSFYRKICRQQDFRYE